MNIWIEIFKRKHTRTLIERFNFFMFSTMHFQSDYEQVDAIKEILVRRKVQLYGPFESPINKILRNKK